MMEIAEASKITRANLNYHFGTKRDLYVEVVRLFARLPPPCRRAVCRKVGISQGASALAATLPPAAFLDFI